MDSRLLVDMTEHDQLVAQDQVLLWLEDFAVQGGYDVPARLEMLQQTEERSNENTAALAACYINTPSLTYEDENRKWDAIYGYYHRFAQAYQELLIVSLKHATQSEPDLELPLIVARTLYYLGRCAKWRFFRYQDVPHGEWISMHQLYEQAEHSGFAELAVLPWASEHKTRCTAIYLRTLMLATLNRTSMTKKEIDLADRWLETWSQHIPLQQQFERGQQLFYVDLSEDCGARRIRNLEPDPAFRYWTPEPIVRMIEQANGSSPQGRQLAILDGGEDIEGVDYSLLFGYLSTEWSCDYYVRQRRKAERDEIRKEARATHGIFGVCLHIKNLMVMRDQGINEESNADLGVGNDDSKKWIINESPYGFGAIVNFEADTWLGVGKLVALDYENNNDLPVIGVLRNIKQLTDRKCLVGIDVISHTPMHALLRESESAVPIDDPALESFLVSALTFDSMPPFPGLYLPRDEERNIPATIIIPRINYTAAGVYEIHMENRLYLVRFRTVVEMKDDWVRVEVVMVRAKDLKRNAVAEHFADTP